MESVYRRWKRRPLRSLPYYDLKRVVVNKNEGGQHDASGHKVYSRMNISITIDRNDINALHESRTKLLRRELHENKILRYRSRWR